MVASAPDKPDLCVDKLLRIQVWRRIESCSSVNTHPMLLLHLTQFATNFNNIYTSLFIAGNIFGFENLDLDRHFEICVYPQSLIIIDIVVLVNVIIIVAQVINRRRWLRKSQPLSVCLHCQRPTLVQRTAAIQPRTPHCTSLCTENYTVHCAHNTACVTTCIYCFCTVSRYF